MILKLGKIAEPLTCADLGMAGLDLVVGLTAFLTRLCGRGKLTTHLVAALAVLGLLANVVLAVMSVFCDQDIILTTGLGFFLLFKICPAYYFYLSTKFF
jgi:hypothetical protein